MSGEIAASSGKSAAFGSVVVRPEILHAKARVILKGPSTSVIEAECEQIDIIKLPPMSAGFSNRIKISI